MRAAGELHDVGKMAIPDVILNKPGPLDETEWEFVRRHSIIGERIVAAAPALAGVAKLVRSVHERWDGSGYPDNLAGEQIPLGARVVCVSDAFHAMVADRPYRKALTADAAIAELRRCAGSQFDATVVRRLLPRPRAPRDGWAGVRAVRGRGRARRADRDRSPELRLTAPATALAAPAAITSASTAIRKVPGSRRLNAIAPAAWPTTTAAASGSRRPGPATSPGPCAATSTAKPHTLSTRNEAASVARISPGPLPRASSHSATGGRSRRSRWSAPR